MKRLLISLIIGFMTGATIGMILSLFIGCGGGVSSFAGEPVIEITEPLPEMGPVKFVFHRDDTTYLYDGNMTMIWNVGHAVYAGNRKIASGSILYTLDDRGYITGRENILLTADLGYKVSSDFWSVFRVSPQEAYDAGYMMRDYTQIYKNSTEHGAWYNRQYYADQIIGNGTDVFVRSKTLWYHINGTRAPHIVKADFIIEDFNATARTMKINGVNSSCTRNFINGAQHWQKTDGGWISNNGYFWDGVTLNEFDNRMTEWRVSPFPISGIEAPLIISAGTQDVNGDLITYWIECNSGWLIAYNIRLDTMTMVHRLYMGDGTRASGIIKASHLNPVLSGGLIMFSLGDGYMYEYNFNTGLVRQTYLTPVWIVGW